MERLEAGHMLSPHDGDLRKDEMEEKLEAGHMLYLERSRTSRRTALKKGWRRSTCYLQPGS